MLGLLRKSDRNVCCSFYSGVYTDVCVVSIRVSGRVLQILQRETHTTLNQHIHTQLHRSPCDLPQFARAALDLDWTARMPERSTRPIAHIYIYVCVLEVYVCVRGGCVGKYSIVYTNYSVVLTNYIHLSLYILYIYTTHTPLTTSVWCMLAPY